MPQSQETHTYRGGKKLVLTKNPEEFVVRTTSDVLAHTLGITDAEPMSPASARVTTRSVELDTMMNQARTIAPTHHAYYIAATGEEFLITDRVFVTFHDPLPAAQVDAFAGQYGLMLKEQYSDRNYLFQLTDHTGMNPVKLVVKLVEEEPLVASAEHDLNHRMQRSQLALPTDPAYAREWHLQRHFSHPDFDPRSSSRCEEAWQQLQGFGSADVVVGVTDDGCKLTHGDFDSVGKFASWGYFRGSRLLTQMDIDADPTEMYKAGSNHGTSCAGVIAGEVDAALTVGAAPGCRLLPIQWESSGPSLFISDSKLLTALHYLADKVDVVSNSWGSAPSSVWPTMVLSRLTELARSGGRRGRGIVFLWAAGNENCPIQHRTNVDVPYDDGVEVRPDGSAVWVGVRTSRVFENNLVGIPGVLHVAALASTAQRSHYSNYGTGIGICAPSSNSHEYHRLTVRGLGIITTTGETGLVTERFGGTSSATPLVAGIAALVISANPDLTALEVITILQQTASKNLSMEGYPRTPAANFDANTSWDISPITPFDSGAFQDNPNDPAGSWSAWFGYGRVDAPRAVAEAIRRRGGQTQETLRRSSTPAVAIPDNNANGVRDTIHFPETGRLGTIEVRVDLTHTYIGDLRLTLLAPSGAAIVLHNRNGSNASNIQRTFDMISTPGLSMLAGQAIQGDWTLWSQDLAALDEGVLQTWEILITPRQESVVELMESPGATIPDHDPQGIERVLTTSAAGHIKSIEVAIDITHTYIGDLEVQLIAPNSTTIALHRRSGGSADNLITTYTEANTPALQALRGQAIAGAWRLKVADVVAQDVGKCNRWALRISK